jgi:hypothetical protein
MVEKCVSGGVLNKEEEREWERFLEDEDEIEKTYYDKEQIHYCAENGKDCTRF